MQVSPQEFFGGFFNIFLYFFEDSVFRNFLSFLRVFLVFPGFSRFSQGFPGFPKVFRVFPGFSEFSQGFPGFPEVFQFSFSLGLERENLPSLVMRHIKFTEVARKDFLNLYSTLVATIHFQRCCMNWTSNPDEHKSQFF